MSDPSRSQIERVEDAIAAHLKAWLPNDVAVDVQPDDPTRYDTAGKGRIVLVHFSASSPSRSRPASHLGGPATFAIVCLAQALRGGQSGYLLLEAVETAMAGATLPGCREFRVTRSRLLDQSGSWWRWAVEVETELVRGRAAPLTGPFIERFEKRAPL